MKPLFIAAVMLLAVAIAAEVPVIQPKEAVTRIAADPKPLIIYVGPNVLFRSKHIPAAVFAGPGSKPEGIDLLKDALHKVAHDREILIYCGCCPWDRCPNINPVMAQLKSLGFTRVKAVYLPNNFKGDWIDQGYPVTQ